MTGTARSSKPSETRWHTSYAPMSLVAGKTVFLVLGLATLIGSATGSFRAQDRRTVLSPTGRTTDDPRRIPRQRSPGTR
jgi:hypothetical protein